MQLRESDGPVRVMHVVHTFRTGGMEMGVLKIVNGLDPVRVRSSICSTTPAGEIKAQVDPRVPVFELARKPGLDAGIVTALKRLFERERPHIVHTHAWGTLLEGLVAARLAGVPVVVHGEHGTLQVKAYQRWLQRIGWTAADRVLSVSSVLAMKMAGATGLAEDRITTIRNGVDLNRFRRHERAAARRTLGLPEGALIVGTVGRLVPVKDQATLIDAVALLRQQTGSAMLVIAGDGPEQAALEARAARHGLGDACRLLGYRPDVETVLAALDVFALSSVSEGLSNTILEAMAAGCPVVATRVGGAGEMVDDGRTGILVEPRAPEQLAEALGRVLLDADTRVRMGAAARQRVAADFSLESMMSRYDSLYMELAAQKGLTIPAGGSSMPLTRPSGTA